MANIEVVKKVYDALLSGRFKQGREQLCGIDDEGNLCHCFWGVVCELAVENGIITKEVRGGVVYYHHYSMSRPPLAVQEWIGIYDNVSIEVDNGYRNFIDLNDEDGVTFEQFAEILKQNYLSC